MLFRSVPVPPVPLIKSMICVPEATPVPVTACPMPILPDATAVTVSVVPEIEPVKDGTLFVSCNWVVLCVPVANPESMAPIAAALTIAYLETPFTGAVPAATKVKVLLVLDAI